MVYHLYKMYSGLKEDAGHSKMGIPCDVAFLSKNLSMYFCHWNFLVFMCDMFIDSVALFSIYAEAVLTLCSRILRLCAVLSKVACSKR